MGSLPLSPCTCFQALCCSVLHCFLHTISAHTYVSSNSQYLLSFSFHFLAPSPMLSSFIYFHICDHRNLTIKCPFSSYCMLPNPLPSSALCLGQVCKPWLSPRCPTSDGSAGAMPAWGHWLYWGNLPT